MTSYRKMTESDVKKITSYLISYNSLENVLSWKNVEQYSKFTRQALQAHPRIKEAFQAAKLKLANERASAKNSTPLLDSKATTELVKKLSARIALLENQQELWRRRWFRIAYNIRNQGVQMYDIDKPVPIGIKQLSDKEMRAELSCFDQDIPPVASRGE